MLCMLKNNEIGYQIIEYIVSIESEWERERERSELFIKKYFSKLRPLYKAWRGKLTFKFE